MKKTVLITNGRFPATLDLIRNLSRNGNRVIVAETSLIHYCSTSKANSKNYLIPSPRECETGYIQKILEIIEKENVDLFIPGWEDVLITSKHLDKFPTGVAFTSDYKLINALHNKWEFSKLTTRLGFSSPVTLMVTDKKELENLPFESFYIKTPYSRGTAGTTFVKSKYHFPDIEVSKSSPILIQENLRGKQYCTYSICHGGKVLAHSTYPLHYSHYDENKTRGSYCLSFEETHHEKIFEFVKKFAKKTGYTGSLAFDIFDDNGKIVALECNPRLTSGVTLLTEHENLADAYFGNIDKILLPQKGIQKQLFLPALLFATSAAVRNGSLKPFMLTLLKTKDLIFHLKDIKPFLFQPVIAAYQVVLKYRFKKSITSSYSHDLDFDG